jgi:hypothetical protein
LASLDEDYLNARLYLAHSFHILGLHKPLNLLLSVVVNEEEKQLLKDKDVREFLALLARATEPRNASTYMNTMVMNLVVDIEYTLMSLTNSNHRKARPMIDHIVVIFIIMSELQKNIILVDKLFELVKDGSTCIVKTRARGNPAEKPSKFGLGALYCNQKPAIDLSSVLLIN